MKLMTDLEAIAALKEAELKAGHRHNTRKTYQGWMLRYRAARRSGFCHDIQGFLNYLSPIARRRIRLCRHLAKDT